MTQKCVEGVVGMIVAKVLLSRFSHEMLLKVIFTTRGLAKQINDTLNVRRLQSSRQYSRCATFPCQEKLIKLRGQEVCACACVCVCTE